MKRALGLFHWRETVDISDHRDSLVRLITDLDVPLNKISFRNREETKSRHRTVRNAEGLFKTIKTFDPFNSIYLYDIRGQDMRVFESCLEYYDAFKRYVVTKDASSFDVPRMMRHNSLFCELHTPRYGFSSDDAAARYAASAVAGMSIIQMPPDVARITARWQRMRRSSKDHMEGYLVDVFDLNVLSPLHMNFPVEGTSFDKWIARDRKRGQLVKIKDEVHVWLVPPEHRQQLRKDLIASEMMDDKDPFA